MKIQIFLGFDSLRAASLLSTGRRGHGGKISKRADQTHFVLDRFIPKKYYLSMKATTIKIEGNLLKEIESVCPSSQNLTAFVREVLSQDLKRRKMAEAAARYEVFLASHPEEERWLTEWENADLAEAPQKGERRKT